MQYRTSAARVVAASASPIGVFFLRFVRTLILSRLLVPSEVGAAVVLLSLLAACELVMDVGLDRFVMIIDGEKRAQAVAAARQIGIVRAVILAALIAYFAPELCAVFGDRNLAGSAEWLALIPLIGSLKNWRLDQVQREYRYGPEAITRIASQCAAIAALVPGFILWHDHRLLVLSLVCESSTYVLLSHILVRREPTRRVDPSVRKAALAYSLPLMANGVCLMLIKQLDQITVSNFFGLTTLAIYSLGFNLAVTPTSPLQAIFQKIGLPTLSNVSEYPEKYRRMSLLFVLASALLAAGYALPVGLVLNYIVPLLYGQQYSLTAGFASFAMLSAYLRLCRGGPTIVLLQRGATASLAVGNMAAGIGAFAGLLAGFAFRRLDVVMAGFAMGDLASFATYLFLVRQQVPLNQTLRHCGFLTAGMIAAATMLWATSNLSLVQRSLVFVVGVIFIAFDATLICRDHLRQIGTWPPQRRYGAFRQVSEIAPKP
jgi:O-antigen/teichoic acid export membrane protein